MQNSPPELTPDGLPIPPPPPPPNVKFKGKSNASTDVTVDAEVAEFSDNVPKNMTEAKRLRYHFETSQRKAIHDLRLSTADRVFYFVLGWIGFVMLAVLLHGFGLLRFSDQVIMVLLGTTTANIIGVWALVVRCLFPTPSTPKKSPSKSKR